MEYENEILYTEELIMIFELRRQIQYNHNMTLLQIRGNGLTQ